MEGQLPPPRRWMSQVELEAFGGLLFSHAGLMKQLDAELEARHRLSMSSFEVLMRLSGDPGGAVRLSDLARGAFLSPSGLSRLVQRLEADGLIQRVPCADDGRGANAVITPEGRARFEAAAETHFAGVRRLFLDHFDDAELATLGAWFARLAARPDCTADD